MKAILKFFVKFVLLISVTQLYGQKLCNNLVGELPDGDTTLIYIETIDLPYSGVIHDFFNRSDCSGFSNLSAAFTLVELNSSGKFSGTYNSFSKAFNLQGSDLQPDSTYIFSINSVDDATSTSVTHYFILSVSQPIGLSLVLDVSGSMGREADSSVPGVTRLDLLQLATNKFVDYFATYGGISSTILVNSGLPQDSLALSYFTDIVTTYPSTNMINMVDCNTTAGCIDDIKASINSQTPQTSTGMGNGVIAAINQLQASL